MDVSVLNVISFLMPIAASGVCALLVYQMNSTKGIVRDIFGGFLILLSLHFFFELSFEIKLFDSAPLLYLFFLPFNFLISPLLFFFNTGLIKRKYSITKKYFIHFLPAVLLFILVVVSAVLIPHKYLHTAFVQMGGTEKTHPTVSAIDLIFLLTKSFLFYLHYIWYYILIKNKQNKHKRRFGKYYADYEKKNANLQNRILISLFIILLNHLINQLLIVDNIPLNIVLNSSIAGLVVIIFLSGRKQIEIRKYRMYKLSSHEDEVDKA